MKNIKLLLILFVFTFVLSGCLYPDEKLNQNQVPYKDQLASVQSAVDQFREDNSGLLPIKNKDMKTPVYEKYPIDFNKLSPRYMQEPPGNSFESGGIYSYVLINPETEPEVKLIDLRLAEAIRDLNIRIDVYRQSNGYPPFKKTVADGIYTLDYKKLGYKETPYAVSPFSGKNLPFIINHKAEVYIDYGIDLYEALQKKEHSYKPGDDIRGLLVEDSGVVPAFSLPYTIDKTKNEPIFLTE